MNLIQATVNNFLPSKRKDTPSGWTSFNAVCCAHNGENSDTRKRGGIMFSNDGFQYHCFNCNFKAGWTPGKLLSKNTKNLFIWLGIPQSEIAQLNLYALKSKEDIPKLEKLLNFDIEDRQLPEDCLSIKEWIDAGCEDKEFIAIIQYIYDRGFSLDDYAWHWSAANGYKDRLILPFYFEKRIVGWTGRKITNGKPKYLTTTQPGYLFNLDAQTDDRKYVIVVEGQFDALACDGVAVMHNDPNEVQIARLNKLGREVIVVPDRDKPGAVMLKAALENHWTVSLPDWGTDVKDVADAMLRYGKIYVLATILQYRETNEIKIQLLKKKLENINDNQL
jgi:hypothetical protein